MPDLNIIKQRYEQKKIENKKDENNNSQNNIKERKIQNNKKPIAQQTDSETDDNKNQVIDYKKSRRVELKNKVNELNKNNPKNLAYYSPELAQLKNRKQLNSNRMSK